MSSIRSRLAVGYAVTLLLTLGGFWRRGVLRAAQAEHLRPRRAAGERARPRASSTSASRIASSADLVPPGRLAVARPGRRRRLPGPARLPPRRRHRRQHPLHLRFRSRRCRSPTCRPSRALLHAADGQQPVGRRSGCSRAARCALPSPAARAPPVPPISAVLVAAPVDRSAPDATRLPPLDAAGRPARAAGIGLRRVLALGQRPAAGAGHHRRARGDHRRPEPASAPRGAAGRRRGVAPGPDAERHARPAGAELFQPAPVHRRREPRTQDAAHGAAGRRRALPHRSADADRAASSRWTRRWARSTG